PAFSRPSIMPEELDWQSLLARDGAELEVQVMQPEPGMTICDPACGTGGFLLAAYESISHRHLLDPDQKRHLRYDALRGWEIVDNTARLCVRNLLLHGIGDDEHESPRIEDGALKAEPRA